VEPRPEPEATTPETARLVHAVFYGTVLVVGWLMWRVVQPFALEIGWAVVLAICLNPIRNRLTARLGCPSCSSSSGIPRRSPSPCAG
jgi:predicted PurR-regulated permease PerM